MSWNEVRLGDITENLDAVRVPVRAADRRRGPYPYYGASGVVDYVDSFLFDGEYLLVAEDGENLRTRKTPIAFIANGRFWVNNHAHVIRGNGRSDTRFLNYYLSVADISGYLSGSTQPKLTQASLNRIPIRLPPINEQRAIAGVLGALDDKIELNRRMNETLEGLARAVFAAFVSSRPGESGRLGDVSSQRRVGIEPSEAAPSTPYIALEHMPRHSIALSEWGTLEGVVSGKSAFEAGSILFGKLRPYFHKVGVAPLSGACSTDILVIEPKSPEWFSFVLMQAASDAFVAHADANSSGTKMPRASWKDLASYELSLPTTEEAAELDAEIRPLIDRIVHNIHESRTLAELRDALLPKLISGELRVRAAEAAAESAGA